MSYDKTAIPLAPASYLVRLLSRAPPFPRLEPSFCRHPPPLPTPTYPLRSDPIRIYRRGEEVLQHRPRSSASSTPSSGIIAGGRNKEKLESGEWKREKRKRRRARIERTDDERKGECGVVIIRAPVSSVFPFPGRSFSSHPLTRCLRQEFFSLSPSFILSRNPEKYFSTRSFSRVYAIPRSMGRRGRMGEERVGDIGGKKMLE